MYVHPDLATDAELAELAEHQHDYGMTFDGSICRECCLILEAIYDCEAKEGCPEWSRQPLIGDLADALSQDAEKYKSHARLLFPELAGHRLIGLAPFS